MKKYLYIAIAAILAAGCSSLMEQRNESPNEVRFTTNISSFVTKSINPDSGFANGDAISVFAIEPFIVDNVKYTVSGNALKSDTPIYWPEDLTGGAYFGAIFPYKPDMSLADETGMVFSVKTDQSTQENYHASDMLLAEAEAMPGEVVNLEFHHFFTRIDITIEGNLEKAISSVSIGGVANSIDLDKYGIVGEKVPIKAGEILLSDGTKAWSCIVVPERQALPELLIAFADGTTASYPVSKPVDLLEGCRYRANLSLGEDGSLKADFVFKIFDWISGDWIWMTSTGGDWQICGNFTDWYEKNAIPMEKIKEGVYQLEYWLPQEAEFKFICNWSWERNLGGSEYAGDGEYRTPALYGNASVSLVSDGYNLYYPNGGHVLITLNVNDNWASIEAMDSDHVWSVIGTIYGSNWDTDYDLSWDGDTEHPTYYARVYYEDGQEFKFRQNHDWVDPDWGFGPVIMPEPAILNLVGQGPNITLPWTGYWEIYLTPDKGELQFYPAEDLNWQYFLNPDGSVSELAFHSNQKGTTVNGKIKYYEVNGVRTCKTETGGAGVLGGNNNREWYFVWYTDSNLIKLPIQLSGYMDSQYGEATVFSPYYYYGVFNAASDPDLGTFFDFVNNYPSYPEGYYDGNGGFYFGVEWYLFVEAGLGFKIRSHDVIAEGNGYERHDYSGSVSVGPAIQGNRDVTFNVGKDIASVRYVFIEDKIDDDEKAFAIGQQLAEGSINYNYVDQFATDDGRNYYATVTYTAQEPGYHTVVAIGLDAAGQWYFWYYYWFYLEPYKDPSNYTWTSLGTGLYTDDFVTTIFKTDNLTWEVEVQQCDQDSTRIRMVYPYDGKYGYNEEGDWDVQKSYDIEIVIPDANHVYIRPQQIGIDWGHGMFSIASMAGFRLENGLRFDEIESEDFGVLADGVITFKAEKLLVAMADYNNGGWYLSNRNGAFKLVLPDAVPTSAPAVKKVAAPSRKAVRNTGKPVSEAATGNGGRHIVKAQLSRAD
ncbi:MAG: fimbrillin family protein [Bacteroidales bacterium]|nr:fimbrillin family protein [Bacteroidales bacterium]